MSGRNTAQRRTMEEPPARTTGGENVDRLIPVMNNTLGKIQLSVGRGKGGSFQADKLLLLNVGQNLIPEALWKEAEEQVSCQRLLTTKIKGSGAPEDAELRIGQFHLVAGKPLNKDNPLLDLDEEEALLFVANTEALDLLESLAQQEGTASVLQAINRRIKDIKDPKNQPKKNARAGRE